MHSEKLAVTDKSFRQRTPIELLVKEGKLGCSHLRATSRDQTTKRGMAPNHIAQKKPKTVPSAGKITGTVFWHSEGYILVDFLEKGETIDAD